MCLPSKAREVALVAKALRQSTTLESLHLTDDLLGMMSLLVALGIDDQIVDAMFPNLTNLYGISCALQFNTTLRILSIDIRLDGSSALALANALQENQTLRALVIMRGNLGDEGAEWMAAALQHNSSLWVLALQNCRIGAQGASSLANSLQTNKSLLMLDLEGNQIGVTGIQALAESLETQNTLHTLDISRNKCDDKEAFDQGSLAVANMLRKNQTLDVLRFAGNEMSARGRAALADAMETNRWVKTLSLQNSCPRIERYCFRNRWSYLLESEGLLGKALVSAKMKPEDVNSARYVLLLQNFHLIQEH